MDYYFSTIKTLLLKDKKKDMAITEKLFLV